MTVSLIRSGDQVSPEWDGLGMLGRVCCVYIPAPRADGIGYFKPRAKRGTYREMTRPCRFWADAGRFFFSSHAGTSP